MKKGVRVFIFGSFVLLILLLGIWFVLATTAPISLTFSNNVTAAFDEGNFSVNWTSGGGQVKNYSVYIFADNIIYAKVWNNSNTGYSFNNWTEADYTFIIGALNTTGSGNEANSSTNISMSVDRTAPSISLPLYTNSTAQQNSTSLTLNISVIDASSGTTGTGCLVDVNGTNQTISFSGGWCNGTVSLSGVDDGSRVINVYANDTIGNLGLNNSFFVQSDNIVPTASASCSPSSVSVGSVVSCTCSGSDSGSGVASSTSSTNPDTSQTGTFTYTCTVTDNAANSASSSATYTVEQLSGPVQGITTWVTHIISTEVFEQGYTRELAVKNRMKIQINSEEHFIGLVSISESQATIEISSDPVQVTLSPGEDTKVDATNDGFYDIHIILNGITNNLADITIQKIYEEVPEGGSAVSSQDEIPEEEKTNLTWLWILLGIVVLAIVVGGRRLLSSKKKKNRSPKLNS